MPGFQMKLFMWRYVIVALTPKFGISSRSTPNMNSFVRGAFRSLLTMFDDDTLPGLVRSTLFDPWTPCENAISDRVATPSQPLAPTVTHGWPFVCLSTAL